MIIGSEHRGEGVPSGGQQYSSSKVRRWCMAKHITAASDCKVCQTECQFGVTQSLAREQPITCSRCQWWISLRLRTCAPARAYSSSCSAAVPPGTLCSSLRSRGEGFTSALQACFHTSKHFSPCYHFKSGKGAAACQDCAWAVTSDRSCNQAPGATAALLSPAWGAQPPRRASHPNACQPAVQPHGPSCYSVPFERLRNQSF